jgi:hypothetical protein
MRIDNIKLKSAHSEMPFFSIAGLSFLFHWHVAYALSYQSVYQKNISLILSKGINALLISRKSNKSN